MASNVEALQAHIKKRDTKRTPKMRVSGGSLRQQVFQRTSVKRNK